MEAIKAEHLIGLRDEERADGMPERDRIRAGGDGRVRLRECELARHARSERTKRLRHRTEGTEIGTRADDHLRSARAEACDRLRQVRDGGRHRHAVRDVVPADDDDRDVGFVLVRQLIELLAERR